MAGWPGTSGKSGASQGFPGGAVQARRGLADVVVESEGDGVRELALEASHPGGELGDLSGVHVNPDRCHGITGVSFRLGRGSQATSPSTLAEQQF